MAHPPFLTKFPLTGLMFHLYSDRHPDFRASRLYNIMSHMCVCTCATCTGSMYMACTVLVDNGSSSGSAHTGLASSNEEILSGAMSDPLPLHSLTLNRT